MRIRPFTRHDLEEVLRIELVSYSEPWNAEMFVSELEKRGYNYSCVAVDENCGKILGYCFFWILPEDEIHINNIAVHPDYRNQGVGRRLFKSVIEQGRPHRIKSVTLEVRESNHNARNFYDKLGFLSVGRRREYYSSPKEDAILLRLQMQDWDDRHPGISEVAE